MENVSFEGEYTTVKTILMAPSVYLTIGLGFGSYLLLLLLNWPGIELLLFPILSITATIFFATLNILSPQTSIPNAIIKPYFLGNEKKIWQIFLISTFCQIIILGLLGMDSRAHPQLMDNYGILYFIPLLIIYSITWFWIPWTLWGQVRVEMRVQKAEDRQINDYQYKKIWSIKPDTVKQTAITSLILLIVILTIIIIDCIVFFNGETGFWPYSIILPQNPQGNSLDPTPILNISGSYVLALYIFPSMIIVQVKKILNDLKDIPNDLMKTMQQKGIEFKNGDIIEAELQIKAIKS